MNSPFLFQNIVVLVLIVAVFTVCLYLLLSKKISDYLCNRSKIFLVLYRVVTTVTFSISLIGLLVGFWVFYVIEINDLSRDCWERTYKWQNVVPGMLQDQVTEIIGKPFYTLNYKDHEQSSYCTNPIGGLEFGTIIFTKDIPEKESRVSVKSPDDQQILENLTGWIPNKSSNTYANYAEMISDSSAFCAFYILFGLAILSLYPFKLRELSGLRMLYAPFAALLLKAIYESHQANSWNFELFSISLLITIILIGWIVRLGVILAPD